MDVARNKRSGPSVAMVLPHLGPGGAQRVATILANHWAEQGLDVHLITTIEDKEDFHAISPLVKRHVLKRPRLFQSHQTESIEANGDGDISEQFESAPRIEGEDLSSDLEPQLAFNASVEPVGSGLGFGSPKGSSAEPLSRAISASLSSHPPDISERVRNRVIGLLRVAPRMGQRLVGVISRRKPSSVESSVQKLMLAGQSQLCLQLMRWSMWRVAALRRLLRHLKPDTVISFLGATNIMTIASAKGLPTRIVVSERNDPLLQELAEPWHTLRPMIYPLADIVTANSHGAVEHMQSYCSSTKLAYVANPIIVPSISERGRMDSVLFLARLVHQKGPDVLIDAFAQFVEQNPGWTLQVAGDGPMEEELIDRVRQYGISESVFFHGMVKDPTDLLTRSRIFVLPSRFEGTPNSLLEAMAARLACVVTDASPGPLRLIEHDVTGFVVKTGDSNDLASALQRLARDPALRERLARAARERISSFSVETVAAEWKHLVLAPQL